MQQLNNIVPPDLLDKLAQHQLNIPAVKAEIARAKQAGIDVTAAEQRLAQAETQINAILRVYGQKKPGY